MTKTYSFLKLVYLSIACLLFNLTVVFSQSNVGIGTTTPSMTLDIEGNRAAEGIHINNTNAGNGNPIIQFQLGGTTQYTIGVNDADPTDNFMIGTTDLSTTRFSINNNGNVGIGAPNGIQKLHVQCNDASNGIVIENTNGADGDPTLRFDLNGPTQAFTMGVDDSDADAFKICTGGVLGANAAFSIKSDGNIGIGAANPISKLHISRSDAADNMLAIEQSNGGDFDPYVRFENGTTFWSAGLDDSDVDKFKISSNTSLGVNDRLVVQTNGNVGVNTAAPNSTLHVNGSFSLPMIIRNVDYTLTDADYFIKMDASGGVKTVTLPTAVGRTGRIYVIQRMGGNTVTIDGNGTELVGPAQTFDIITGGVAKTVISDGTNWIIY